MFTGWCARSNSDICDEETSGDTGKGREGKSQSFVSVADLTKPSRHASPELFPNQGVKFG